MNQNLICFFSATGNSLQTAKDIAGRLQNTELIPMTKQDVSIAGYERVGFVFPCYGEGLPNIVRRFIGHLSFPKNIYYFTVVTGGEEPGNCIPQINKLLKKKGVSLDYGGFVKMYGNYLIMHPQPDNAEEQAAKAHTASTQIADDIVLKKKTEIPKSKFSYAFAYAILAPNFKRGAKLNFKVTDACISCGKCVRVCPASNIKLKSGRPVFGNRCELCVACIQWCPQKAIIGGKATSTSRRYHHPNITFDEICER